MIGGLIQVDKVGLAVGHNGQGDPAFLPAGERGDAAQCHVAADAEAPEDVARILVAEAWVVGLHAVYAVRLQVQSLHVVLCEAADPHVAVDCATALRGRELALHDLQQRTLACAVRPEDADAPAHLQVHGGTLEEGLAVGVREGDCVGLEELVLRQRPGRGEANGEGAGVREGDGGVLYLLHVVQDLLLALLLRDDLGPVVDFVNELHDVGYLLLLHVIGSLLSESHLLPRVVERVVVPLVVRELLAVEEDDVCADVVQEATVMRNQQDRVLERLQVFLQIEDRGEVQVVCGLVQEEEFGLSEQRGGQGHAHAPTS
mmetsp:Transcript_81038/g.252865  ORF Transcript_81038/g.252865 Transcript_81038/m.252865 type:complete len:316 (+) Transcript_81038:487-1434(+)